MPRAHLRLIVAAIGIVVTGCGSSGGGGGGASAPDVTAGAPEAPTTTAPIAAGTVFADSRFGFNFRYPKDWKTGDFTYDADQTTGARPAASMAVGMDQDNSVLLTRYDLSHAVTSGELEDQLVELNGVITRFAGQPYVGEATDVGGLPAVRYEPFALRDDAMGRSSRVVFLFDGTAEYEVNCQSTPAGRDEMDMGCDQMMATLRRK